VSVSRQRLNSPAGIVGYMNDLSVIPIAPSRLQAIRDAGKDEHGNAFAAYPAAGWEPLRCCLRIAREGEPIALISYSPFTESSPWAEVGPVYVHADACEGYLAGELPPELRTGPRILRSYHADGSLDYHDIVYVRDGKDLEPALRDLLTRPAVAAVHVRASMTQCFTYEVRLR
jgi:DNA-binding Lrp family transcriptional regulator